MIRSVVTICAVVVLCGWVQAGSVACAHVYVAVHNDAQVPGPVVMRAEAIASDIYQKAGIEIVWVGATFRSVASACSASPVTVPFSIRIIPQSLSLGGEDFGVAFLGADGRGVQADVFYLGIEKMGRSTSLDTADLLGHVMAHELGHLLLGLEAHSRIGIMQAHWRPAELHQMSMGLLNFDRGESQAMRARLLGTTPVTASRTHEVRPVRVTMQSIRVSF